MLDLSRREAFVSAAVVALAAGVPSWALAQTASGSGGAAWDLRDIYPTDAAWEADRQAIQAQIPSLLQYKGKLGLSAAELKAALQAQSDLNSASKLYLMRRSMPTMTSGSRQPERQAQAQMCSLRWANRRRGNPNRPLGGEVNGFIAADPGSRSSRSACAMSFASSPYLSPARDAAASAGTPLAAEYFAPLPTPEIPRPTCASEHDANRPRPGYTTPARTQPGDAKLSSTSSGELQAFDIRLHRAFGPSQGDISAPKRDIHTRSRPRSTAAIARATIARCAEATAGCRAASYFAFAPRSRAPAGLLGIYHHW